jgi:DNA-binding NtrC family response regulator
MYRLLVVDDDSDTQEILRTFFSAHGYQVITAQNGYEALSAVSRDSGIDIVLLDVFLPGIGGMEVLREIHALVGGPSVILLTGLADREIAQDALRLGAFDYILKPMDLARLLTTVEVCLDHREYLKQSWWKRLTAS